MTRTNFHQTGYGWNYFFEVAKSGAIRVGRYFTNGHVNSDTQTTIWGVTKEAPTCWQECDKIMSQNQ